MPTSRVSGLDCTDLVILSDWHSLMTDNHPRLSNQVILFLV